MGTIMIFLRMRRPGADGARRERPATSAREWGDRRVLDAMLAARRARPRYQHCRRGRACQRRGLACGATFSNRRRPVQGRPPTRSCFAQPRTARARPRAPITNIVGAPRARTVSALALPLLLALQNEPHELSMAGGWRRGGRLERAGWHRRRLDLVRAKVEGAQDFWEGSGRGTRKGVPAGGGTSRPSSRARPAVARTVRA